MPVSQSETDTICAIATSQGRSGVGIIRVSGTKTASIAAEILGFTPRPRYAHYCKFQDSKQQVIDQGIALFFQGPNSFTGEDVLEIQGHGGVFVLSALRELVLSKGARLAKPGEFSERAFLNNKIDLLQAEAIADLIDASSHQAARSAMRTLQGEFSRLVKELVRRLVAIRVNVEAAIDFSDEDIDVLSDTGVAQALKETLTLLTKTLNQAQQGALLLEGINVVIAGKPNAGKSSLLNALSGKQSAIVTAIPGTTRDILREQITIQGIPLHIFDTAGLRRSDDEVEQEGVRRALVAIDQADRVLLVVDCAEREEPVKTLLAPLLTSGDNQTDSSQLLSRTTIVFNKSDLLEESLVSPDTLLKGSLKLPTVTISAKTGAGVEGLTQHLLDCIGYNVGDESVFTARERHIRALDISSKLINKALHGVSERLPLELVAEDLRLSQESLGTITGEFTSDDLLGEIFANFCVGK